MDEVSEDIISKHTAGVVLLQEIDNAASGHQRDRFTSAWHWQTHPGRPWGLATAVAPTLAPFVVDTCRGSHWLATTIKGTAKITYYNVHLPTSWMPDTVCVDAVQELAADIHQQETTDPQIKIIIGGDWNIDAAAIWDSVDSERHEYIQTFLHEWGLCIRSPMHWGDNAKPSYTSYWMHPVAKTRHEKTLDCWAVSRDWEHNTSARAHSDPTRSDHAPILFERHARDEFIMELKPQAAPPRRWRSSDEWAQQSKERDIVENDTKNCDGAASIQEALAALVRRQNSQGRHPQPDLAGEAKEDLRVLDARADRGAPRLGKLGCEGKRPTSDRAAWPEILEVWARRKFGSEQNEQGAWLEEQAKSTLAACESRDSAERLDGGHRTPIPDFSEFEECLQALRVEASPAEDGITSPSFDPWPHTLRSSESCVAKTPK